MATETGTSNPIPFIREMSFGDGTEEKANLTPFLEHERKTGTLSYVFIKCSDERLSAVKGTPTQHGYHEEHFLRVAGSTKILPGNLL